MIDKQKLTELFTEIMVSALSDWPKGSPLTAEEAEKIKKEAIGRYSTDYVLHSRVQYAVSALLRAVDESTEEN